MPGKRQLKSLIFGPIVAISIAFAMTSPAQAQVRQIDGNLWSKSTVEQKQAYLIGVANLLAVNQELQVRKGSADANSPFSRYLQATDAHTIASVQQRLDAWYAANPDKLGTPVLGVLWMAYVKASQ